jgi:plastocyanin
MRVPVAALLATLALAAAPAAQADERIVAGFGNTYLTPMVTIDQGERTTFLNTDLSRHDVVARQNGPDRKPLFASELASTGQEVPVNGAQSLVTGSYRFFCSIHPFMEGTLNVSSAGSPQPPPGGGQQPPPSNDTTAPTLSLRILDRSAARVRRSGRLRVRVETNEAGHVSVGAAAKGKRIARGARNFSQPGAATVSLRLTKAGRRALSGPARVKVSGTARDRAGNAGGASARRKLGR